MSSTTTNDSPILQVHHQSLKDASQNQGMYTGAMHVPTGTPHGQGEMLYTSSQSSSDQADAVKSYKGMWEFGLWEGQGFCTLQNGDTYQGTFVQGERHGSGLYQWAPLAVAASATENSQKIKERSYQGDFHHNQRHGHGVYTWKTLVSKSPDETPIVESLSTYTGSFQEGQRHGHGTYQSPSLTYTGEWCQGQYHGYGVLELTSKGTVYRGFFHQGQRQGRGTLTKKIPDNAEYSEMIFQGMWEQDRPVTTTADPTGSTGTGASTASTPSGKKNLPDTSESLTLLSTPQKIEDARGIPGMYSGMLLQESKLPHQIGTMQYFDAGYDMDNFDIQEYQGFWQQGRPQGHGRILYRTGHLYVGNVLDSQPHGTGEYTYQTVQGPRIYKGEFVLGQLTTTTSTTAGGGDATSTGGTVLYPNGDMYTGPLQQWLRQGRGKFEFQNGAYYVGPFQNGKYHGSDASLVTLHAQFQGEFQEGVYHGQGQLRDANGRVLYEGMWKHGKPTELDTYLEVISKQQLAIPHPPLDEPCQPDEDDVLTENDGADEAPPMVSNIVQGTAGLSLTASNATDAVDSAPSNTTSTGSTSFWSSLWGSSEPATPTPVAIPQSPAPTCKAVVDVSIRDAQDHPGKYTGLMDTTTSRPNGVGRMVYQDGNRIHEGFWLQGHRHGHGRCWFANGDIHEGEYEQSRRHGPGTYRWKDGRTFVGNYHYEERQGQGRFMYPNGNIYQGEFLKGQRHGQGTFVYFVGSSKCRYQGGWKEGIYDGKGQLEWTQDGNTHVFRGSFRENTMNGPGEERINGQLFRQGIWEQGRFAGDENATTMAAETASTLSQDETVVMGNHSNQDPSTTKATGVVSGTSTSDYVQVEVPGDEDEDII
eukprot:Nitzschia sp. Nitz4//scaffold104_size75438//43123//45732//NITZ4_005659-RA/size75438-processed-gene-0.75-mRNA-1//-1//CDS//3329532395//2631//frame0